MNATAETVNNDTAAQATADATTTAPATDKALALDNLTRAWFEPGKEADAEKAINAAVAIATHHGLPVAANWDTSTPKPADYALAIVPQMLTVKQTDGTGKQIPVGLYIGALPTPEAIAAHGDAGNAWLRKVMVEAVTNRFANCTRVIRDPKNPAAFRQPSSVPFKVEEFITAAGRDNSLVYFRKVAPAYVDLLKTKGVGTQPGAVTMTRDVLQAVLSSAATAQQLYAKVPQARWETLLDKMLADAKAAGIDPGLVAVWRASRDTVEVQPDDFDLDGLDSLDAMAE